MHIRKLIRVDLIKLERIAGLLRRRGDFKKRSICAVPQTHVGSTEMVVYHGGHGSSCSAPALDPQGDAARGNGR